MAMRMSILTGMMKTIFPSRHSKVSPMIYCEPTVELMIGSPV
jgi:hypothetical protein